MTNMCYLLEVLAATVNTTAGPLGGVGIA
jgi:hypothetical protein